MATQGEFFDDTKAVTFVPGHIAGVGALKVRQHAVTIGLGEDGREELGADAVVLVVGVDAEHRQIPVRLARFLLLYGSERADRAY